MPKQLRPSLVSARSSYGQPVLVDEYGTAYGTADFISPAQAADYLGKTLRQVQFDLQYGRLKARKVGDRYIILVADLLDFQPRPAHRPQRDK